MFIEGQGVRQNYPEGVRWLKKAADKLDAEALSFLGSMHYDGHKGAGVKKDRTAAFPYFLKATKAGDFDSIVLLILMYAIGDGVKRNYPESYKWASYLNHVSTIAGKGRPDVWSRKEIWSGKALANLRKKMTVKEIKRAGYLATRCIKDEKC